VNNENYNEISEGKIINTKIINKIQDNLNSISFNNNQEIEIKEDNLKNINKQNQVPNGIESGNLRNNNNNIIQAKNIKNNKILYPYFNPNINSTLNEKDNNNEIFPISSNNENEISSINNNENISKSPTNEKAILQINDFPSDEFSFYIFNEINKIRSNPKNYIDLFTNAKENVLIDSKNRLIYKKNKIKVALFRGIPAFDETIEYLKDIEKMDKLIFNKNLCIKLPKDENEIKDKNYLKNNIINMIKNGIKIKSYWRDIIIDKETSFILMIVDDISNKSGEKRNDIFNKNMKYIGINSVKINNKFACYIVLSNK
jgi:hypothetical protein